MPAPSLLLPTTGTMAPVWPLPGADFRPWMKEYSGLLQSGAGHRAHLKDFGFCVQPA